MSEEAKRKTFGASVGRFTEIEDKLDLWIDGVRRENLPFPPSLAILKAKKIAEELLISQDDFNPYHPNPEKIDDFDVACSIGHKQIITEKIF